MWKILAFLLLLPNLAFADTSQEAGRSFSKLQPLAINFPTSDAIPGCSIASGVLALSQQYLPASYCNIALGYRAMQGKMTAAAVNNIAVGYQPCQKITSGSGNICLGGGSAITAPATTGTNVNGPGASLTTGSNNIFVGAGTGAKYSTGSNNIVFEGEGVISGNGAASNNVLFDIHGGWLGSNSVLLQGDTAYTQQFACNYFTLIGFNTGRLNACNGAIESNVILIGGSGNTAPNTNDVATSTSNNVLAITPGIAAINGGHAGTNDTAIGFNGLHTNAQDSAKQACFGFDCLFTSNVANARNSGFGYQTGKLVTTGTNNVFLGYNTGSATLTTGSSNIILGSGLTTLASGTANEINVGGLLFYNNASTAAPTLSSCGTGSPAIDANANDKSGTVTAGTVATTCTITFASAYGTFDHCRVFTHGVSGLGYTYTKSAIVVTAAVLGNGVFEYDCDGV